MKPLNWEAPCITFVTTDILEAIESPFPYIIGVDRVVWDSHFSMKVDSLEFEDSFFTQNLIFDLDRDFLQTKFDDEAPKEKTHHLTESLKLIIES